MAKDHSAGRAPSADLNGEGLRIAVVCARFNDLVTGEMLDGVMERLAEHGVDPQAVTVDWVPGAFELPLAAHVHAESGADAVIAVGCIIRGDTPHFDYVAGAATDGLLRVSLDTGVPVVFGVLTTETLEQALERSGIDRANKGGEAADTAVEMARLCARRAGTGPC